MHEVDRHELDGTYNSQYSNKGAKPDLLTELAVNSANEFVDHGSQVLVLFDILSTRHSDLNQDDLANPLGVLGEENLKSVQLLRNALDVIQTIHTDDELHALELALKGSNALLNLGLFQTILKLFWVNADGESTDSDNLALELNAVGGSRETTVISSVTCDSKS